MEILGVITARGGSRRIPRKNVKLFCGKPLITYTIEAAQKSQLLSRVILSSEDEEIIQIAKEYGLEVPFVRPRYLATEDAKSVDVLIHAVKFLEETENYKPDIVVILEPTSPLRTAEDIDDLLGHQAGLDASRSKKLGIFSIRRDVLIRKHNLFGDSWLSYSAADDRVIDINTMLDFTMAEQVMKNVIQSNA